MSCQAKPPHDYERFRRLASLDGHPRPSQGHEKHRRLFSICASALHLLRSEPASRKKSLAGLQTSLQNAKLWVSDVVLLVPAVVNAQTSYRGAWKRSQEQIRKLIPLAEESKIVIAIEEIWNKLLSPLEMDRPIREFQSPWIKVWVRYRQRVALRVSAGLDSCPWEQNREAAYQRLQAQRRRIRQGESRRRRRGLAEMRKAPMETGYIGSAIAEPEGGDET